MGKFEIGNKIGHRFSKDNQPAPERRSGGRIDRVALFRDAVRAKPLTSEELHEIDTTLLTMTREELGDVVKDPRQPIVVQARAKQLLDKATTFDGCEKLLDRSFGKPTIKTENTIDGEGLCVNISRGDGLQARTTEDEPDATDA